MHAIACGKGKKVSLSSQRLTAGRVCWCCVFYSNALRSCRRSWRQRDRLSTCRRLRSASPLCASFVPGGSWKPYHSEDIWKRGDAAILLLPQRHFSCLSWLTCTKPSGRSAGSFPWRASGCLQSGSGLRIPDSSKGTCGHECVHELWSCTCWVTTLCICRTSILEKKKERERKRERKLR